MALGALVCVPHSVDAQPADTIDRPVSIYVAGTAGGGRTTGGRAQPKEGNTERARTRGHFLQSNGAVSIQTPRGRNRWANA